MNFYQLAKNQPDLQDVCEYLKHPMAVLEDILARLEEAPLPVKTSMEHQKIYYECDKLIHQYFPSLIENYCDLSLDYRNSTIIKTVKDEEETKNYTAKELLLHNIEKLTEETLLLSNRFNESYSYEFLVKNRMVSQLGLPPQVDGLQIEYEIEPVKLDNQFDYNNFKKHTSKEDFLKKRVEKEIPPPPPAPPARLSPEPTGGSVSLIEVMLIFTFFSLLIIATFVMYQKTISSVENQKLKATNSEITYYAKSNIKDDPNFNLSFLNRKGPFNSDVSVKLDQLNSEKALNIQYANLDGASCVSVASDLKMFSMIENKPYEIQINGSNNKIDENVNRKKSKEIEHACDYKTNTVSIITPLD